MSNCWIEFGLSMRPHSRFGDSYLWNVYLESDYVARAVLDKHKKINPVWINVSKHATKLVTPEIHAKIQEMAETVSKSNEVCTVCHLPASDPLCEECYRHHRMPYHELIKKIAAGETVNARPTLSFYHYEEADLKRHLDIFQRTGELPKLSRWH